MCMTPNAPARLELPGVNVDVLLLLRPCRHDLHRPKGARTHARTPGRYFSTAPTALPRQTQKKKKKIRASRHGLTDFAACRRRSKPYPYNKGRFRVRLKKRTGTQVSFFRQQENLSLPSASKRRPPADASQPQPRQNVERTIPAYHTGVSYRTVP